MQVTITIRSTQQKFPGGTVGGSWHIDLANAADPASIINEYEGASPSTVFDLTEGDVLIARGFRLDVAGATLGPIATDQFTVGQDLVVLDVAQSVSENSTPARRAGPGARR
jgi:hypothetical protein